MTSGAEWLDTDGIGIQTTSDLHKSRNAAYGHAITKSGHAPGPRIRHLRDGARTRTGGLSLSVSAPPRPHDELEKTRYPSRMPEGVAQSGMSSWAIMSRRGLSSQYKKGERGRIFSSSQLSSVVAISSVFDTLTASYPTCY